MPRVRSSLVRGELLVEAPAGRRARRARSSGGPPPPARRAPRPRRPRPRRGRPSPWARRRARRAPRSSRRCAGSSPPPRGRARPVARHEAPPDRAARTCNQNTHVSSPSRQVLLLPRRGSAGRRRRAVSHAGAEPRQKVRTASIERTTCTASTDNTDDRKWWTLAAVCTGVFMLLLDLTIVNVALPDIERAFRASLSDLQWVIDAYALTLAALLLTAARSPTCPAAGCCSPSGSSSSRPARLLWRRTELAVAPLAGRTGRRRRDHVRDLAGAARPGVQAASAASRSACSARSPGSPSRSARCSAGRSRAG